MQLVNRRCLANCTAFLLAAGVTIPLSSTVGLAQNESAVAAAASDTQVGEIIVSARRRNEMVQDAPLAITALTPSQLEGAAAKSITDCRVQRPMC